MRFETTAVSGVWRIEPEPAEDERGFFARTWCQREFAAHGLSTRLAQCSVSFNRLAGTLRGLHYQAEPHGEEKLVRCTQGSVFDVAVDLRPESPTYLGWAGAVLSAGNHHMLYLPQGCAHGFLTLEDDTEVFYQISEFYHPDLSRGVRWNDDAFGIEWPGEPRVMADRDRHYPDYERSSQA